MKFSLMAMIKVGKFLPPLRCARGGRNVPTFSRAQDVRCKRDASAGPIPPKPNKRQEFNLTPLGSCFSLIIGIKN